MPRRRRTGAAGLAHHVLNRACRRATLFADDAEYREFVQVLSDARERTDMRILAYVVMPNHWHLIVWPDADLQLSRFMHWLTLTHTKRWHVARGTTGTGPLYQGRYKAIPVQSDEHLLTAIRYVERNPVRAGLVARVQNWPWSSVWERSNLSNTGLLAEWPFPVPGDWLSSLNAIENASHLAAMRQAVRLNTPLGDEAWRDDTTANFNPKRTFRRRGRPRRKLTPDTD
jgi:REP-associated tyrosine transposase